MNIYLASFLLSTTVAAVAGQHTVHQPHYLVGLLNYPNSFTPDVFKNHTSGIYIPEEESPLVPFKDVPSVGFSDIEFYYDDEGNKVLGQYYCLSDNGK